MSSSSDMSVVEMGTLTLFDANGIVTSFMEKQEKVTHCEVPDCGKKLFGNTYMCCRPLETVNDMTHKGHTCCEDCAKTENYIEKNRCKVCLAVATGRRSGTKGAGYPLQPPQLNKLATDMLEMIRSTEESVLEAREKADEARRQVGASLRAEAVEAVKRKREEEAIEEAKKARIEKEDAEKAKREAERLAKEAEEKAERLAKEAEEKARKEAEKEAKQAAKKAKEQLEKAVAAEREKAVHAPHPRGRGKEKAASTEEMKKKAVMAKGYRDAKKAEMERLKQREIDAETAEFTNKQLWLLIREELGDKFADFERRAVAAIEAKEEEEEEGGNHFPIADVD